MGKFLRLAAGVLCVGILALGVVVFDPSCLLTYPTPPDPKRIDPWVEQILRREHLKQMFEASFRRVEARWQIAKEVVAGRRSLAEAIEQFRDLDRQRPDLRADTKMPELAWMSEDELDELDGRTVIEQVRQVLADRPDQAAAIVDRLEKQLQQLLADQKKRRLEPADPRTEPSR